MDITPELKDHKQICEEDIRYIKANIQPDLDFSFLPVDAPYYNQLHGILSALIYTYALRDLDLELMSCNNDNKQDPKPTITDLSVHCRFRTLDEEEQFTVFQLLGENNVETLLQLSMEDCDTLTYNALRNLFCTHDPNVFVKEVSNVKYSATKVSKVAQAICVHSDGVAHLVYSSLIIDLVERIETFNNDYVNNTIVPYVRDYLPVSIFYGIRPELRGLQKDRINSFIDKFENDYKAPATIEYSDKPAPSSIGIILVQLRKQLLDLCITSLASRVKCDLGTQSTAPLESPSEEEDLSLTATPSNIGREDINAFCAAFACHCTPNNSNIIKYFFWRNGNEQLKQIEWRANIKLFVAYIHYAYKDKDLPYGTEEKIKQLFTCKGKPINIAGYGKSKYEDCYSKVEDEVKLYRDN